MEDAIIRVEMTDERAVGAGAGAKLVEAACAGDRDAFGRLVGPYLASALGAATLIAGNDSDGLSELRNAEAFPAWFRSIVVRAALATARRTRHIVELDMTVAAPLDQLDRALDLRTLRHALVRLDHKDRVLLTLHHYWELPVAETARLLGVPEGTVKSRVHHAMQRLRAAYDAEERP